MSADKRTPPDTTTTVNPATVGSAGRSTESGDNLDLMLDVPLTFSAELGGCNLTVRDILQLVRGKVIELDKLAGEPLDLLVNGRLIARGEAVVVNERFGVRIIDIASPSERLTRMGN